MVCRNHGRLWSTKCVLIFVLCVGNSENPMPDSEGVWSMCNTMKTDMVHGFQQWQDRCWQVACTLQMMRGVQTRSAANVNRKLDIHCAVHRIVLNQLDYREVCAHWVPKNPTNDDKAHCMGLYGPILHPLDMLHWSKRAVLELKRSSLHKTWNQKNGVWWRNYHLRERKWKHCHQ